VFEVDSWGWTAGSRGPGRGDRQVLRRSRRADYPRRIGRGGADTVEDVSSPTCATRVHPSNAAGAASRPTAFAHLGRTAPGDCRSDAAAPVAAGRLGPSTHGLRSPSERTDDPSHKLRRRPAHAADLHRSLRLLSCSLRNQQRRSANNRRCSSRPRSATRLTTSGNLRDDHRRDEIWYRHVEIARGPRPDVRSASRAADRGRESTRTTTGTTTMRDDDPPTRRRTRRNAQGSDPVVTDPTPSDARSAPVRSSARRAAPPEEATVTLEDVQRDREAVVYIASADRVMDAMGTRSTGPSSEPGGQHRVPGPHRWGQASGGAARGVAGTARRRQRARLATLTARRAGCSSITPLRERVDGADLMTIIAAIANHEGRGTARIAGLGGGDPRGQIRRAPQPRT